MNKSFPLNKEKIKKDLIILIALGLILLAVGLFDITLLVLYVAIILIIAITSYKERMVAIEGDKLVLYYRKTKETFDIEKIRLIEIEPRKATYRTMGSIKNLHIEATDKVIQFNIVNIYSEELNDAIKELSKQYGFPYFKEHVDMNNEENDL